MEQSRQIRHDYLLSAELEVRGETINGQVLNWAEGGIRIFSVLPLEEPSLYRVRFCLEQKQFEETPFNEANWEREGTVVWQRPYKEGSWIGIKFDEPLELPFEQLEDYLSAEDFCQITLYTASEELTLFDKPLTENGDSEQEMPPYHWGYWAMWAVIVAIEIGIILLLTGRKE